MLTILYHKIRGFSQRHIVFKDGKVIADFAHVVVPITTWRLWNQPTMRYPSVRKQRFHRLGNDASDPPVTLAKIAMMLRANAGRSILPQNTIPSPRLGLPVVQLFPLPNTQPTPRITRCTTVPSAKHPTAGAGSSPTNGGHPHGSGVAGARGAGVLGFQPHPCVNLR